MEKLIQGLHQFHDHVVPSHRAFFASLARGQRPTTLFITCSDSRVNPNLLTQTGPGELFIVRNAGCLVPPYGEADSGEAASIEYAICVLGVEHVVVCGHSHCGAMSVIANKTPLDELPAVSKWLRHADRTAQIVDEHYGNLKGMERLRVTTQENVVVQMEHLRTHPSVARATAAGKLHVHGWMYKIETGEAFGYEASTGQFLPLVAASADTTVPPPQPVIAS